MRYLDLDKIDPVILGHSQKGQDSLIKHIFDSINTTNRYYVEFGAVDGYRSCNTAYFRDTHQWNGLLLDCSYENINLNLHKKNLNRENILDIFREFDVPKSFDFLCVDIDGNDYWLLEKILTKYSPRVIMVEINALFDPSVSVVQKYDPSWRWNAKTWFGASPLAVAKMCYPKWVPVYIHRDDMILVDAEDLRKNEIIIPTWKQVYPRNRAELYIEYSHIEFDPDLYVNVCTSLDKF